MIDKHRVSVVTCFLDAEQYIEETIESVIAQTYEDWELLLVDDGSKDGSTAIARKYCELLPDKVRYLEHEGHKNLGTSTSRNLGNQHAQGEYIAYLDSDDVWLPYKLEQQVTILDAQPDAGMLYGRARWWYSWTGRTEDLERDFVHPLGIPADTVMPPPTMLNAFFFRQDATIPTPSDTLIRREVVERIHGWEDGFSCMYDDQAYYAKICLTASMIACDTTWTKYRQHKNSCVSNMEDGGLSYKARVSFLMWLSDYLSDQKVEDAEIWEGLKTELWRCRHPTLHKLTHNSRQWTNALLKRTLPAPAYDSLQARWSGQSYSPPVGSVRLGNLRRVTPISREFGYDRGLPIDRYYIDRFLSEHSTDIHGNVLEFGDDSYQRRFGDDRVKRGDIWTVNPEDSNATITADLTQAEHVPTGNYDCIIITQTLQFIYDLPAAIASLYRMLKPGGVVLATVPGISQISRYDMDRWGHYWSFTSQSTRRLFEAEFPPGSVEVVTGGNVLAATAFLYGLAASELNSQELDYRDPDYELIISIRAVKPVET